MKKYNKKQIMEILSIDSRDRVSEAVEKYKISRGKLHNLRISLRKKYPEIVKRHYRKMRHMRWKKQVIKQHYE